MMIVTSAADFLGSCMISKLNQHNFNYVVAAVDAASATDERHRNLLGKKIQHQVPAAALSAWLNQHHELVEFVFHLDADPLAEPQPTASRAWLSRLKTLWQQCVAYQIPLIFAAGPSQHTTIKDWVAAQPQAPFFWAGLLLPGVYGPNEYYLKGQASLVYRAYQQPYVPYTQPADWVYVRDVADITYFLLHHRQQSGFYPVDTGRQYSAQQIQQYVADARRGKVPVSQPPYIAEKLRVLGYAQPLHALPQGAYDYVQHFLMPGKHA